MSAITFPLKAKQRGNAVLHLQDGLLLLIEKIPSVFIPPPPATNIPTPPDWPEIIKSLKAERSKKYYGKITTGLIISFQTVNNFQASGNVDEQTAEALNYLIDAFKPENPPSKYSVSGQVSRSDNTPFSETGFTVQAFDQLSSSKRVPLGTASLQPNGKYIISYDWKLSGRNKRPNLLVRLTDPQGNMVAEGRRPNTAAKSTVNLTVNLKPELEEENKSYTVKGMVRLIDGSHVIGAAVLAFDRDLRSEQELGKGQTDKQGFYQIQYSPQQFTKYEKGSADLVVKAFAKDGKLLAASPVLFNASPSTEVDLTVPDKVVQPPSLFEKIYQALKPLLDGVKITELEENEKHKDVSFLSGETGINIHDIARFAMANRLAEQAIEAEFWFAVLGGSFYKFNKEKNLKEQLKVIFVSLPSLDATALRKTLARAFNQKEISETLRKKEKEWVEAFLDYTATQVAGESDEPTFVKLALEHAKIRGVKKQKKFARLFNEHKALTLELLEMLEKDGSFKKTEIADLRTSFELSEITQGDFSVIKVIKEEFKVRQPENIRSLAKKSTDEWVNLVSKKHAAGEIKLPLAISELPGEVKLPEAEIYGKTLERQFRETFPTTAFTGGLERALSNGGAKGLNYAEPLGKFLEVHQDFEILETPVDDFLADNTHPDLATLAKDEGFRTEVKAVQRVFKLAPTFEATDTLLADDIHSAQKVYRMGETEFVRRYEKQSGFTTESARLAWNRAADTHAAVLTIVGDLKALEDAGLPLALKNSNDALSTFPNWNNLFKAGDLCECAHCRSVLSPAAYFADLLMFLKDRNSTNPKPGGGYYSVKDTLFERRSDLGFLELNCDNGLTPLPYIDVVCEVLEDAVDNNNENDLELAGFTVVPLDSDAKTIVAQAFKDAFANPVNDGKEKIDLGADFSLSQVEPSNPDRWVVHGDDVSYLLKKKEAANFFAEILRNTKTNAAELRASPQYVNPQAYKKLREAKYPFALPFDLFAEEVRAVFQKSNLKRWDLMRTLRGSILPYNPGDREIAAEYFNISADPDADFDEKRLVFSSDDTTVADWLASSGSVKIFLQKTGLTYNEMLALLDLLFINPTGDIVIDHKDMSCDTDQKEILGLDMPKLDRIHRFLRLWRKLDSWKMWELDLVIRHPAIGNNTLDEDFLVQLFYFDQIKKRLGNKVTVEQVCALFGELNTQSRFTKLHKKREEGLYQSLFLNRRLIQPLDPAFQLEPGASDLPLGETYTNPDRLPVVLAALGIRESDLRVLKDLTKASDETPYISDNLNIENLSFLWRHSWLAKKLKFTVTEWRLVLKILQQDISSFVSPEILMAFIETIDHLKATDFKPDELNWLLTADRAAKAAMKEADAARFLTGLRKELQTIKAEYDSSQYDFMTSSPPTDVEQLSSLLSSLLQKLNRDEVEISAFLATLRGSESEPEIDERSRLSVKFFEPNFSVSLETLPVEINFTTQLPANLARKIVFDPEQRKLSFSGIMWSEEKLVLELLSADLNYRGAINSLFEQPRAGIVETDERIWLTDNDLDATQPANDTLAKRLANAINRALLYLTKTLSENIVIQQSATQFSLTETLTRHLLTRYTMRAPIAQTLMTYLTQTFTTTSDVVDYASQKNTFDAWFWAIRVATIWNKWKINIDELGKMPTLIDSAPLLDFSSLPLDDINPIVSIEHFLQTRRLLQLRDTLPETGITLFAILEKVADGKYAPPEMAQALFAEDVQGLNQSWLAPDVQALVASLDISFPDDYLRPESWERLRRAFYFLDSLNASADTAKTFAAVAMTDVHAKMIKELLRSKFGAETWLTLNTEIQDVLRERKRDALVAYLLNQPDPEDAPSGKWENTNDLYAYYLLDVEMSSCQLTSRLVQSSGSVQLFVQRCFMGLEPDVVVNAGGDDGDSAWRWWQWMRKYRVWEANRKVFLWPENWIEPELKKDRSSFFKDLENELLQNEINQQNVEKSFTRYLEKLNNVAQLEIAGFYQEDDGDDAIIHVFGRTAGAEPHLYYYRRYDYRQWTPWEKVELDIQGDYLIPAVVNKRLYLFWPVFTEVPDETENSKQVLIPGNGATTAPIKKAMKKLKLQMAVSDYRQGKWTPRKISRDYDESKNSYDVELVKKHYRFFFIDMSLVNGRFGIKYDGYCLLNDGVKMAELSGAFEISGCKGVPEKTTLPGSFENVIRPEPGSTGVNTNFLKWIENRGSNDFSENNHFTLVSPMFNTPLIQVLMQTPWTFKMTPPWQLSYMDRLWQNGWQALGKLIDQRAIPLGSWLPFFYNDKKRTFFVLPSSQQPKGKGDTLTSVGGSTRSYYPEIKKIVHELENYFEGLVKTWVNDFNLSTITSAQRQEIEQFIKQQFGEAVPPLRDTSPSYTDEQVRSLITRFYMRFFHYYLGALSLWFFQYRQFHFKNFYHPFVCDFAKLLYNPLKGIPALMSREIQFQDSGFSFDQSYQPTPSVVQPETNDFYPQEIVDFSSDGAYSSYNWELFFHAPLLIANSLSKNQRFEEAREWYHFMFNPIGVESTESGGSPMSNYWITKPFFETTDEKYKEQRIEKLLAMLTKNRSGPGQPLAELEKQVKDWRSRPFEPHRIANYRTVAYQKTVVMKYLDNLIAWGDNLFRQDSMESINEATQLYVLAAEILGPRPKKIPPQAKPSVESFNELEQEFDKFSNALVEVENLIPLLPGSESAGSDAGQLPMLYFCIPQNDKMLGYWDTVADRLYKIRNCMNIEGVVRQLALFEPPIDPGALVKAVAGGVDIGSALADLNAPLPLYRFNVLLQKANEMCNDVKALGGALLSALEKKDAEALGLLRQGQEIRLLEAVKFIREKQIEEIEESLEGLSFSKSIVEEKRNYYRDIEKYIEKEDLQIAKMGEAQDLQEAAQGVKLAASIISILPAIDLGASGFGGSPLAKFKIGGLELGQASNLAAEVLSFLSQMANNDSAMASSLANFERRWNDWKLQERLAEIELDQMDKQIAATKLRIAITEKELENHLTQIENAKATDDFMRSKYTNEELYQWQIGQVSGVYFQSYKLAYDLAKRAERCFRFELGLQDSSYINFGYWDSLKKGLLSGEKLQYDLRRLETAYLEKNRREFELTKNISLTQLDPLALVRLRETGRCFINLPEEIFDLDFPGHYFRRIKSVSLTLPCVVGPYTTISCTLRLLKNSIRINTNNGDNSDNPYSRNIDDEKLPINDDRFIENNIPVKAIAASSAQNDSGVFELSFRDERYLPFEGAGVISNWSLELFNDSRPDLGKALRQFDYGTISDAILHVKYTAREDAGSFKNGAVDNLQTYFSQEGTSNSLRVFNLKQEFPDQWNKFLYPPTPADGNIFELDMAPGLFPLIDQEKILKINTIWLLARCKGSEDCSIVMTPPLPEPPPDGANTMILTPIEQYGGMHFSQKDVSAIGVEIVPADPPVKWQLMMTRPSDENLQVEDILLMLRYEWG